MRAAVPLLGVVVVAAVVGTLVRSTPPATPTSIEVRGRIIDAVGAAGRVWALTCTERCTDPRRSVGRLLAIDPRTGHARSDALVRSPQAVAAGAGSIWTADFWHGTVTRFSARTGRPLATVALRLPRPVAGGDDAFLPFDLAAGEGAVWVSTARGYVARIDPAGNRVATTVKTLGDATGPIVAGGGSVWIGQGMHLGRLDPTTRRLSQMTVGAPGDRGLSIGGLALARGGLWVAGEWARPTRDATGRRDWTLTDEAVLTEVDPATGAVRSPAPLPPRTTLHSDGGRIWLANAGRRELDEFSPTARRVVGTARVRATGAVIAASGGRAWVQRSPSELALVRLRPR